MPKVVLIPGDGIGVEISECVKQILEAAGADIDWIPAEAGQSAYDKNSNPLPQETIDLIDEHKVVLKGPLTTPVGSGFRSVNVSLRQKFDLYANIRPAKSLPGVDSHFTHVDLVTFRENTQGLYIGQEKYMDDEKSHAESVAVVTREASDRIIRAAFDYAVNKNREKVTLVHKANILKLTTGMFLEVGREVSKDYPDIEFTDMIVDNCAMQMVLRPEQFDIIVTTNLFGDILSDLASGLVGGLGMTGSANMGKTHAMFEAVHGSAPDIVGRNIANPTALLFSATMMLEHFEQFETANRIRDAVNKTLINKNVCTPDLGGRGTTQSYSDEVCNQITKTKK